MCGWLTSVLFMVCWFEVVLVGFGIGRKSHVVVVVFGGMWFWWDGVLAGSRSRRNPHVASINSH